MGGPKFEDLARRPRMCPQFSCPGHVAPPARPARAHLTFCPMPASTSKSSSFPPLSCGSRIEVLFNEDRKWYACVVDEVTAAGDYHLTFEDGDEGPIAKVFVCAVLVEIENTLFLVIEKVEFI